MSTIKDILEGLRATIELNTQLAAVFAAVSDLTREMRAIDRRLVRIETSIEIARLQGAILRIRLPPADTASG